MFPAVRPTARVEPERQTVGTGQSATLACVVTGEPAPQVTWMKVREELTSNHQVSQPSMFTRLIFLSLCNSWCLLLLFFFIYAFSRPLSFYLVPSISLPEYLSLSFSACLSVCLSICLCLCSSLSLSHIFTPSLYLHIYHLARLCLCYLSSCSLSFICSY